MLDTFDIVKYVAACADSANVGVVWAEPNTPPRCDGKTIYVPKPTSSMTHVDMIKFKRAVAHETSHVKYSDFGILKELQLKDLEHLITNAIEDHRIDTLNDTKYTGDSAVTEEALTIAAKNFSNLEAVSEVLRDTGAPLMAWEIATRNYLPSHDFISKDMASLANEKGAERISKLHKYDAQLEELSGVEDKFLGTYLSIKLAKEIAKEVFGEDVDEMPTPEELQKKMEEQNGGDEGEGDGEGSDGEGEKEGKGGKSKGETKDGEGESKELRTGGGMIPDHADDKECHGGGEGWSTKTGYTPDPMPKLIDWTSREINPSGRVVSLIKEGISNKVRTLLQVASRSRTVYAQKKGKLNNSSLHRIPVDVQGYSDRVFKRKIVNNTLDTAVTLLVDCSGSMEGSKIEHAAAAAGMMNNVMNNVLHVNTEVLGFTEHGRTHVIYEIKRFGSKKQTPESIGSKLVDTRLSTNVDGESLMYAYNRIKGRKEKRKIIFILSDGMPCGGGVKGNIGEYTKQVIQHIEKSKVELYAIGIHHDCSRMYKHSICIDDPSTLEQHLLEVLKNTLIGK